MNEKFIELNSYFARTIYVKLSNGKRVAQSFKLLFYSTFNL